MSKRKNQRKQAKKALANNPPSQDDGKQDESPTTDKPPRPVEIKRKLSIQETCDLIAELGESILEDPDKAFSSTELDDNTNNENNDNTNNNNNNNKTTTKRGPSKMQQLLTIASTQETINELYTAKLAIMSLLAIYKDIIPSYRIRVPTEKEMAIKISKDTKRLWDYERALLQHYQRYLKLLEKTYEKDFKKSKKKSQQQSQSSDNNNNSSTAITAIISLAELLKHAFHFNFRSNLMTLVVRQICNRKSEIVRKVCCDSVAYVFANDTQGEVALEGARQVAKLIKDRGFQIQPEVIRTFLALPLRVHVDEAEAAKIAAQAKSKKRKRDREMAEIEAEMQEGQATVDKIILARCQSDTLQVVTLTCFRVLKNDNLKASHIEQILPPSLEVLAKFAHLINIDTVMDLLDVLKLLLKKVDTLPFDAALNCILTAFSTLQGPGKEMKIDQKEYIVPLYNQLPRLCSNTNSIKYTETVIRCLNLAFIKRREYSTIRIAAFFKQIITIAMYTPSHTSIPLLAFTRQLIQRYTTLQQMLENEQDVITSGQYTSDVNDPEHCNPFATSAWELATLRFHINLDIVTQATGAASSTMLQLPAEGPERLRNLHLENTMNELYIPFKRSKKKHPLIPKNNNNQDSNKKSRQQVRFITPRQFESKFIEDS